MIQAGSRTPSLSVPLAVVVSSPAYLQAGDETMAVVATTVVEYKLVLALSWIKRLAGKSEIIVTIVRVVASCWKTVASVKPCVVQHTK